MTDLKMPCITKKYKQLSDYIAGRRNLSGIYFARKQERGGIRMAEIKIKSFGELRDIVIEGLKEGTVISVDLTEEEDREDDSRCKEV